MEEKKNNCLYWVIGVLTVLVLGLGGYIVYDKIISNKESNQIENNIDKEETKQTVTNNNNNNEEKDENINYNNYYVLKKDDLYCTNHNETINGINIKIEYFGDDDDCRPATILINNKKLDIFDGVWFYSYTVIDKAVVMVFGDTSARNVAIYNTVNNKLTNIDDIRDGIHFFGFTIDNNKLIFEGNFSNQFGNIKCSNYNNATVEIETEMEYLGNGEFSQHRVTKEVKGIDNQDYKSLCEN